MTTDELSQTASALAHAGIPCRSGTLGATLTTIATGGPLSSLVEPETEDQLKQTLVILNSSSIRYRILGNGSNLLIPDSGVAEVVIRLGRGFRKVIELGAGRLKVGGASALMTVSREVSQAGLLGLEFAGGIPASVGGAIYMNAGAHGGEMSSIVETVTVMLPGGEIGELKANDLNFSYRKSSLPAGAIVTEAVLRLTPSLPEETSRRRAEFLAYRKSTQPLTQPSFGSVFVNPPEDKAGRLIEAAGLKGSACGGVSISSLHANWIVNPERTGTTADVLDLMCRCQEIISSKFGVALHPEVVRWY